MSISNCFGYLPLGGISASIYNAYDTFRKAPLSTAAKITALALVGLAVYNLNPNLFSLTNVSTQNIPKIQTNVSKGWFSTTTTQIKFIERTITKTPTALGNVLSYLTFDQIRGEESVQILKVNLSCSSFEAPKKIPLIGWSAQRAFQEVNSSLQSFALVCALNECRPLFYRLGSFIKSKINPKTPAPPAAKTAPNSNSSPKKRNTKKVSAQTLPTDLKDKNVPIAFVKKFFLGTLIKVIRQQLFGSTASNILENSGNGSAPINLADYFVTKSE